MPVILHAADLHLDSPFSGLTPELAQQRRREQRELLQRMAALVRERGVQLVLLSGDILDGPNYYADTANVLCKALAQMAVPVFLAPGNHDPAPLYRRLDLPDNVTVFASESMTSVPLPELNCTVHGRAFTEHTCRVPFDALDFRAPDDGQTHILCLHGDVDGQNLRFCPISQDGLAASGAHYAALGHVHKSGGLQRSGGTVWAYSGCPEGRGFDETGDKGVFIGPVEQDRISLDFVPVCRRRYHVVTARLTERLSPEQALLAALPDGCGDDVVRVIFTGESRGLDLPALTELAGRYCFGASILDHTTVPHDLLARAAEDSLAGYFLRALQEQRDDPAAALALRFAAAALENGEDPRL